MPQFIGRPNLPSALANKLVQLAAMQNDPIAAGIKSAAGSIAGGIEKKAAKEDAQRLRDEQKAEKDRIRKEERQLKIQLQAIEAGERVCREGGQVPEQTVSTPAPFQGEGEAYGFSPSQVERRAGLPSTIPELFEFMQGLPVKPQTTPAQDFKLKTDKELAPIEKKAKELTNKKLEKELDAMGKKKPKDLIRDYLSQRKSNRSEMTKLKTDKPEGWEQTFQNLEHQNKVLASGMEVAGHVEINVLWDDIEKGVQAIEQGMDRKVVESRLKERYGSSFNADMLPLVDKDGGPRKWMPDIDLSGVQKRAGQYGKKALEGAGIMAGEALDKIRETSALRRKRKIRSAGSAAVSDQGGRKYDGRPHGGG